MSLRAAILIVASAAAVCVTTSAGAGSARVSAAGPGEVGLLGPVDASAQSRMRFKTAGSVLFNPLNRPGTLPPCLASDHCELMCYYNGAAFICEDENGTSIAVTNDVGGGAGNCLGGTANCVKVTTDGEAPYIAAATAAANGLDTIWTAPHTVRVVAFTDGTNANFARVFSHGAISTAGFVLIESNTAGFCYWNDATSTVIGTHANGTQGAWSVVTCTQTGNASRTARFNGDTGSIATNLAVVTPTAFNMYFGRDGTIANRAIHGYIYVVYIYSSEQSAEATTAFEQVIYGTAGTNTITTVRDSTRPCAHGSTYEVLGPDMPCVDQVVGVTQHGGTTNILPEPLDMSAWSVLFTPTVVTDTDSGPFADFNVGPEADTIGDDSATDAELFVHTEAGWTAGDYSISFIAKSGTRSTMVTQIGCAGGGTGTSTVTHTLTSTFARYTDTATCVGNTSTYFRVYPASTTPSETGTVIVSFMQFEQASLPSPPCISTGAATTCDADIITFSSTGMPTVSGAVSMTVTPLRTTSSGLLSPNTYPLDARPSGGVGWGTWLSSALVGRSETAQVACAGQTFTDGVPVDIKFEWDASTMAFYRDGVLKCTAISDTVSALGPSITIGSRGFAQPYGGPISVKNLQVSR